VKAERLRVIGDLIRLHAMGWSSRAALLRAYLSTLRTTTSQHRVRLRLRIGSSAFTVHMRRSDVFVLEEVLLQRQYELVSTLPTHPTIVDAGANIGISALWFAGSYSPARLFCFEPEPANFSLLTANVGALPGATVEQMAVGSTNTPVTMFLSDHGAMHSLHTHGTEGASIQVPSGRLDDYLARQGVDRVDLLKVDVEGSEFDVVRGLGDRLDSVGVIVGELHEGLVDGPAFYQYLADRGFRSVRKEHYGTGAADGVHAFELAR
jgi:FkbM family methyltransferase